jgi:hypothetical protein
MQRMPTLHRSQRGLTMFGFLFVALVFIAVAMLAMKLVPAYIEFFSVKKILNSMGQESGFQSKSNGEIRNDFDNRAGVSYVTVVKSGDLTIDRSGGVPVVKAEYEFRTQLVGNVSLVVDFSASSNPGAAAVQVE